MKKMLNLTAFTASIFYLSACVTDSHSKSEAPEISSKTSTEELVDAAIGYGGPTYVKAIEVIRERKSFSEANEFVKNEIIVGLNTMKPSEIANATRLFRDTSKTLDRKVFVTLIFSELNLARQMGWQLASALPSASTAKLIDDALSLILAEGNESTHFIPQMAQAVAANGMASAYKVLKRGLTQTGDDAFAKAMIALNPTQASADFLDYIALAPIEDLRQLNQNSVNVMTSYVVLNHMAAVHPPLDHPKYEHLFFFAVSRNQGLAELARIVLEDGYANDRARLAFTLARLPSWIQVAFVEGVRRNLNPNVRGFLAELRKLTVQDDVLEELKNISL